MKNVFLVSNKADAHCYKLMNALSKLGAEAEALAFERPGHYKGREYDFSYTLLAGIEHGHYFKRLLAIFKTVPIARTHLRGSDIAYAFGLDMLLFCRLALLGLRKRPKIILEVCDILPILLSADLKSRALRWLERILIRKISLLVVTSKAFVTGYYEKIQGIAQLPYFVIENKLSRDTPTLAIRSETEQHNGCLRIGYFGSIRCRRSLKILKAAAERAQGRVRVYLRGIPMGEVTDIEAEIGGSPWIEYGGPYLSPDDLPQLYGDVDIVWVCFTYVGEQVGNWMWARTNRFYEACFYKKPIIARLGTEDGRVVAEEGIGVCVAVSDVSSCVEQILAINPAELQRWRSNLDKLREDTYLYTDEHQRLMNILSPIHSAESLSEEVNLD